MSTNTVFGLVVAIAVCLGAQVIHTRALLRLNPDQRNQLITYRASGRAMQMLSVAGLVMLTIVVFAVLIALDVPVPVFAPVPCMILAFTPAIWGFLTFHRGLRALGLPEQYLAAVWRSRLVMLVGFLAALGMIAFSRA